MYQQHFNDSLWAMAGGSAAGTYSQIYPHPNPWISQVVIPLLGALLVPLIKEATVYLINKVKRKK